MSYIKVEILLTDDNQKSRAFNKTIMDYLLDRQRKLNDAGYVIAVVIIDDDNINTYVKLGVSSIPALALDGEFEYGVSNILAALAKLEVGNPKTMNATKSSDSIYGDLDPAASFHDRAMKEMMCGEQDDPESASTVRAKGQDFAEQPISDKDISERMSKYDSFYSDRKNRNNPTGKRVSHTQAKPAVIPAARANVEKLIADKGYDKGEAAFMREIARNLERD